MSLPVIPVIPVSFPQHLYTPVRDKRLHVHVLSLRIRTSNTLNRYLMMIWTGPVPVPGQKKDSYLKDGYNSFGISGKKWVRILGWSLY